ncbi:hypothetical protein Q0Z83_048520 [Actinoplanes sichuanensis]|uniref:Nucleotidyltransferase n=1 Tax=Actinoplanes sichuanensis TaxID=512349 RepID=A0ABW4ANJ2_9ACTN|nr:hypothetical protein [Actinoplanes sichuanensis]BEL06661.1 hypothetical protein Q0Z83_048520 [Actinoplanes sichuanensis]
MNRRRLQSVLVPFLDRVPAHTEFRLVGTASAVARGVPLSVGDVDVLMRRRSDVDTIAAALTDLPCRVAPTWLPEARQYFAAFTVDGIALEISTVEWPADTDTLECAGPGPWAHYDLVELGPRRVPVVSLELRLVTELVRNRPDRFKPLLTHIRRYGGEHSLLLRAMRDRQVDPALRKHVADQLATVP